jgi:hypothetical protein
MPSRQAEKTTDTPVDRGAYILDSLLVFNNEQKLIEKFGKENVRRDTAYYPEGSGEYMVTLLYPDSDREVEFVWNDSINFSGLNTVRLYRVGSQWKTQEGITVGTSLQQLVSLNEKEIEFTGLGWDDGGVVFWNNGKLHYRGINVTLALPENYDTEAKLDSIIGDQQVSSNWALAKRINPTVQEVSLDREHE